MAAVSTPPRSGSTSTATPWSSAPSSDPRPRGSPTTRAWNCGCATTRAASPPDSARTLTGQATLLSGGEAEAANRLLHKRYGWQYNLVPLLPLPGGVNNVDAALPWREKWQRVRNPNLWPGSAIVQVQLGLE